MLSDAWLGYLVALGLAVMPALGNTLGGLATEFLEVTPRALSLALHLAAGIVLGVVAIELLPRAMAVDPSWLAIAAFAAGGIAIAAVERGLDAVAARSGSPGAGAGPWLIFVGVSVDLLADGILIGTGTTLSVGLALLLAIAQTPADVPEGFATMATFKDQGLPRRRRLLLLASFWVPIMLAVTLAYWGLREAPEAPKLLLLAFAGGVLMTVAVEEMLPQAHQRDEARAATLVLIAGFALFALLSIYLG